MATLKYALVTAARNEEATLPRTIEAVLSQTLLPVQWIIVSDCSSDRTDEIVSQYLDRCNFLTLVRRSGKSQRDFSSKVEAFNKGLERLTGLDYDFLGNLDADITFSSEYYRSILQKFVQDNKLGIAGGIRYDKSKGGFKKVNMSRSSVGGGAQVFRRKCFEETGGLVPIVIGGEDALVEIKARMHGWRVEHFPEVRLFHHRATGTAGYGPLKAQWRFGMRDYFLAYHPLFEIVRCLRRANEPPYLLGTLVSFCGYLSGIGRKSVLPVPQEVVKYLRKEQMERLRTLLRFQHQRGK